MLSRLKNKFRRVSRGADSTPDVTQVVASCDNDVTTNLDESHQFTQTVDTAADARMRQRKTGGLQSMENQQKRLSEDFPHEFSPGPSKDSSQELVTREKRRDKLRNFYYAYMSRKRSRGAIIIDQSGDTMTSRTTSEPKRESHLTSDDESDPSSDDSSSESSTNEDLETRYEVLRRESICRRSSRVLREDWVTVQRGIEDMDCLEEEPECDYGKEGPAKTFLQSEAHSDEQQDEEQNEQQELSRPQTSQASEATELATSINSTSASSSTNSNSQNEPSLVCHKNSQGEAPVVKKVSYGTDSRSSKVSLGGTTKRVSVTSYIWDNAPVDSFNCSCHSRKLAGFIFVYNECTNRHWEWVKLPHEKKIEADEPDWDESWQPTQPEIVTIIGKTVKSKQQNPKQKLHTISRQFNFFENPLDQIDGSQSESEKSNDESSMQDWQQRTSKQLPSESHHAMTRINGVPWKKNVLTGSYRKRRDISLLQVELMIAEAETYPGSDEVVLHAKRMRKKSSVGQQRKSTVMPALLEDSQDANAELDASQSGAPSARQQFDGLDMIRKGNVARLIQGFKNDSTMIENNMNSNSKPKINRDLKIECVAKTSLIFKGNGKFESIIMAGQTGAANEETLALGGPVEIVAKREFFVGVSWIYIFSAETLKEEKIEMISEGQKEVENLGMNRFGSDLVSRMIAQYTQMDERTASRNQVPDILDQKKVEENEERTRRVQETFRKRQQAELKKCIWTSRMRHFRDSLAEIVGAKFLPEKIMAVIPEELSGEDFMAVKKYMRLELVACSGKNSALPKHWPQTDTLHVVSSLIDLSHSDLEQIVLE